MVVVDAIGLQFDRLADGLLGVREIFGDELPKVELFRKSVKDNLELLYRLGAQKTVEGFKSGTLSPRAGEAGITRDHPGSLASLASPPPGAERPCVSRFDFWQSNG